MGDDAWDRVVISTEALAEQERKRAAQDDVDRATKKERDEQGRLHSRSQGDRGQTGGA
jgi:hypothetical protein